MNIITRAPTLGEQLLVAVAGKYIEALELTREELKALQVEATTGGTLKLSESNLADLLTGRAFVGHKIKVVRPALISPGLTTPVEVPPVDDMDHHWG